MILCQICNKKEKTQVRGAMYTCDDCNPRPFFMAKFIETEDLKGYGKVKKSRLRELERRVILPIEPTDGSSYYVGRRGENGKIQEREPDYR